jgi:2-oxo-4-hydroxy-4-carboxy-5-ureidoimidazoline decarboxylase
VRVTLDELNAFDRDAFVKALGAIFERAPWVPERAWSRRPFGSIAHLHQALVAEVAAADPEAQLALIRAHPDLGARVKMTDHSTAEQAGAGLDRLTPDEFERIQRLNGAYRTKFGFPFLFAVKGRTTHDVLQALETRVTRSADEEFREALQQIYRIAGFRLADTLDNPARR